MGPLPLKIQVQVRDLFADGKSEVQTCIKELRDVLGQDVVLDPEWQLLFAELQGSYPDGNFVSLVVESAAVWVRCLLRALRDDVGDEDWVDTLLARTGDAGSKLRVFLEVSATDKASTSWSDPRGGFIVALPKTTTLNPADLAPVFQSGLSVAFAAGVRAAPASILPAAGDDWADVEMDAKTGVADVVDTLHSTSNNTSASTRRPAEAPKAVEFLPSVASLPKPDALFLRPPYHLVVCQRGDAIEVQGSHSPSLQLLADYLKRWCRVDHQDTRRPAVVHVALVQSAFGFGELFDRLRLSPTRSSGPRETAPMLLAFIEGVLGYECVSVQPDKWTFRRDLAYQSLE